MIDPAVFVVIAIATYLASCMFGQWIYCWYVDHRRIDFSVKTDVIETVNKYRWSQEIPALVTQGKKPWCKGYRVEHYYKNKFFPWIKPTLYQISYEIIKDSDF